MNYRVDSDLVTIRVCGIGKNSVGLCRERTKTGLCYLYVLEQIQYCKMS